MSTPEFKKIKVFIEGNTLLEVVKGLEERAQMFRQEALELMQADVANTLEKLGPYKQEPINTPAPGKKPKRAEKQAPSSPVVEEPETSLIEGDDDFAEIPETDPDYNEPEAPKPAPAKKEKAVSESKERKISLEGDLIPGFQTYATKYGREKAGALLAKYGVKSVRALPVDKFQEIAKILGV